MQNFPSDFEKLERKHIEVFLSPECPIFNIEAKPHQDPEVI